MCHLCSGAILAGLQPVDCLLEEAHRLGARAQAGQLCVCVCVCVCVLHAAVTPSSEETLISCLGIHFSVHPSPSISPLSSSCARSGPARTPTHACPHNDTHVHTHTHTHTHARTQAKMGHNQKTMKTLGMQFAKGGTCMWFAPSGGRDRRSADTDKVCACACRRRSWRVSAQRW